MATLVIVFGIAAIIYLALVLSLRALLSTGVPVRATPEESVASALDLLELKPGERLVDLGCGFGRVLKAARRRAQVEVTGIELNPTVAMWAWLRFLADRMVHVRIGDFRKRPLPKADAVFCYLLPKALKTVTPKLEAELPPGTRVVAIDFPIPGWKELALRETGPLRQPVRLYVVGRHMPDPVSNTHPST